MLLWFMGLGIMVFWGVLVLWMFPCILGFEGFSALGCFVEDLLFLAFECVLV